MVSVNLSKKEKIVEKIIESAAEVCAKTQMVEDCPIVIGVLASIMGASSRLLIMQRTQQQLSGVRDDDIERFRSALVDVALSIADKGAEAMIQVGLDHTHVKLQGVEVSELIKEILKNG